MRLTITSAWSRTRPREEQAQKLVSAGRLRVTNQLEPMIRLLPDCRPTARNTELLTVDRRDKWNGRWQQLTDLKGTRKANRTRVIGPPMRKAPMYGSRCPQIDNRPSRDLNTGVIPRRYHALARRSFLNASPQSAMARVTHGYRSSEA
jgi:hypothetical protein